LPRLRLQTEAADTDELWQRSMSAPKSGLAVFTEQTAPILFNQSFAQYCVNGVLFQVDEDPLDEGRAVISLYGFTALNLWKA